MTLNFTTKERYKRAVRYMMHDCKHYEMTCHGKYLWNEGYYGYIEFEENLDYEICEYCGKKQWHDDDDFSMWLCKCGRIFCDECFIKRHGESNLRRMVTECRWTACPDCFEIDKDKIFKQDE